MKPMQNTIIRVLPAVAFLTAITLRYILYPPHGQFNLFSSEWIVFGAALAFVLVAVGRRLLGRWRHLPPPQPLSRSEIGYCSIVILVGCMLSYVGTTHAESWLVGLGGIFMVAAIAVRMHPRQPDAPIVPTYKMALRLVVILPLTLFLFLFLVIPVTNAVLPKMEPAQPRALMHPAVQKEAVPLPEPRLIERGK